MAVNGDDFVIYPEDLELIDQTLREFVEDSESKCCLLVHRNGQLVAKQGFTSELDTTSLAALAAGAFASTKEIARLVGEKEFSALVHEGKGEHIYVTLAGEHTIMVTVFNQRTTLGMVRLYAAQAAERLAKVFEQASKREPPDIFGEAVPADVSADLFPEQK